MMRIVKIREGTSYRLEEKYIKSAKAYLENNSDLPVRISEGTISFQPYIVGSFMIDDLVILIEPRIAGMTTNHYFEMQLFTEGLLREHLHTVATENMEFGIQDNLTDLFLTELTKLIAIGVEGDFIPLEETTDRIKGRIQTDKITPENLLLDMIPVTYDVHTRATSYNKIIKLALERLRVVLSSFEQKRKFSLAEKYFEEIEASENDLFSLQHDLSSKFYYENEMYPAVLGLAKKILLQLKVNMRGNDVKCSSFLVNSNVIFEEYVRAILSSELEVSVCKWDRPREIGQFEVGNQRYYKSVIPDVLIGYDLSSDSALAVIDVKNKDISDLQNLGQLSDLYQILFYYSDLSATYGALIYPSQNNLEPVQFFIKSFQESVIYAFGVDFSQPIFQRHAKFCDDVKRVFHLK